MRASMFVAASIRVTIELSPQRNTAPDAPAARRMDDVVQAGLLARGSSPSSAFPDFARQSPVAFERRIYRRQLRGQLRICLAVEAAQRTGFPLGRST